MWENEVEGASTKKAKPCLYKQTRFRKKVFYINDSCHAIWLKEKYLDFHEFLFLCDCSCIIPSLSSLIRL
jgi:hypothetical protein